MRFKIVKADVTPTVTAASAYSSGNALGGLMTFTGLGDGSQIEIMSIRLIDLSNQKAATDILLFDRTFTATADKNAIAVSAADCANLIGRISILTTDWTTIQSGRAEATKALTFGFPGVATVDNNVYAQLVTRGTPTYATAADVLVRIYAKISMGEW